MYGFRPLLYKIYGFKLLRYKILYKKNIIYIPKLIKKPCVNLILCQNT